MIIHQNILAILRTFLNMQIKNNFQAVTTKFLSKIPNRIEISKEQFNLCEAKISLDEIIKSINSQTNNKASGNDALTAEFYKYFSNKLAPVLLNVYDSWGKVDNMGITSRTEIISVISIIHMIKVTFTNIQSKIKIIATYLTPLPLFEEFARSFHFQCCYTLLQLRYLPISLIRNKEIQI